MAAMAAATGERIKFLMMVSYYGRGFVGWQRQMCKSKDGQQHVSVQEVIEGATRARMHCSSIARLSWSRVTRRGQRTICWRLSILPNTIRAQTLSVMDPLAARRRTKSKCKKYVYYIEQGPRPSQDALHYSWFIGKHLSLPAIRQALNYITGTHDFRSFSMGLQKDAFVDFNTTRTIMACNVVPNVDFSLDLKLAGSGDVIDDPIDKSSNYFVCIEITGNGFLRHMVRRIIGTLRPIGEGRLPPESMLEVLHGRREPGPSVPSRGLWLHQSWMTQDTPSEDSDSSNDDDQ
ncbi:hypothetical protein Ae201684P_001189 [Aphanomyces euteiches]|nr:hypothetical protein Ae201684P_001189 [Aphanomyces euteiches]